MKTSHIENIKPRSANSCAFFFFQGTAYLAVQLYPRVRLLSGYRLVLTISQAAGSHPLSSYHQRSKPFQKDFHTMSVYEASIRSVDPTTGNTTFRRILQMRAKTKAEVRERVSALGLDKCQAEDLLVYAY